MTENEKKGLDSLASSLAVFTYPFIASAFIMWGWNILAPHLNTPLFTYWEIFIMRMGFAFLMKTFWQRDYKIKS